jgi:hypothetical protein
MGPGGGVRKQFDIGELFYGDNNGFDVARSVYFSVSVHLALSDCRTFNEVP